MAPVAAQGERAHTKVFGYGTNVDRESVFRMSKLNVLHFILLLFLCRTIDGAATRSDSELLLEFAKGIDKDPLGSISGSWLPTALGSNGCPTSWHGVTCDSKGRVTGVDLAGLALTGRILPNTLAALPSLTFLSLRNNFFSGLLPDDLGHLSQLQQLDLSNNLFTGGITFLSAGTIMGSLQNLSLAANKLSGPIPGDAFGASASSGMLELNLANNALTGPIPASIVSLNKLVVLDLSCNQLSGTIPARLNLMPALQDLDLHSNRLSGFIPPSSMLLHAIQRIDLSMNRLSGPLPWLSTLLPPNLLYVNMSLNRLSGYLAPEEAANLFANKIQVLDLSSNQLSGSLPSFEFVFSLRILKLNSNQFTGFVPPALLSAEASLLEQLDLSDNLLSGNVWAISAARLNMLNLSINALSGGLPPRLGSCAVVDLSSNSFSGNLSVMKTWGNSLEWISLSNNSLTGTLPNQTAQLLRLISLNLSNNRLSGQIPATFATFPKLTSLDVSGNTLFGSVPAAFFFSTSVATLKLSNNHLSGRIPLDDSFDQAAAAAGAPPNELSLSPLRLLDLSANQLNGSIPGKLFTAFPTLEALDLSENQLSGSIPQVDMVKLDHLQQLDLSSNHLTGTIPSALPPSLTLLRLAGNNFTGSIPSQLETRFPPSSFYPGNTQLESNGFPAWSSSGSPQANQTGGIMGRQHKSTSSAFKAGLIGGCAAALILVLVIAGLVYYRRATGSPVKDDDDKSKVPVFRIVEKDFVHHRPAIVVSDPEADKDKDKGKATAVAPEHDNTSGDNVTMKKGFLASSAIEHHHQGASLNTSKATSSPDKLAGDLFLLDTDVAFTAEELSRAPAEVLGRSSHGTSYKATLDNGHTITVKWLKEGLAKSKREFTAEARKFGSIRHENVLPLRGYYWGPREHEKLLLTDYTAYGSLADRVNVERTGRRYPALTWLQRLRVAADIARGLCYLHGEHKMAHGNLKASNVLFHGPEMCGRLTDYGLYRLMTAAGTASQLLNAGALGYRAPELSSVRKPKPTTKADIYAFGVILLELVTGRAADDIISGNSGAVDLPDWVRLLVSQNRASDCFDPHLLSAQQQLQEQQQVLNIAIKCISEASARPAMRSLYDEVMAIYSSASP